MRTHPCTLMFAAAIVLQASCSLSWAATGTFSWLPNTETNLAGYKIHYGTASKTYTAAINVGKPAPVNGRVTATVTGLDEGKTYYFAATAYDTAGMESGYSTEVVYGTTAATPAPAIPAPVVQSIVGR